MRKRIISRESQEAPSPQVPGSSVVPDISGGGALASLARLRLA